MQTMIFPSASRILLVSALAVALVVAGCDSSGSNQQEEEEQMEEADFTVTTAQKTDDHPHFGQGFSVGYVIDGDQGKEITLDRGETYTFQMDDVPTIHPFYITTSEVGQGEGDYSDGVENNGATGNETLTFTPPSSAPDTLYYNCVNHAYMGGRIIITSSGS